jgi:hypothetical protein
MTAAAADARRGRRFRAVATRYDKHDCLYQATVNVVSDPDLAMSPVR